MAGIESLKEILIRLERANQIRVSVKIRNSSAARKLIKLLEEEQLVSINKKSTNVILAQPTKEAVTFIPVAEVLHASRNDLLQLATTMLPTITGRLLLTTSRGIMTHHDAIRHGIGGQIFGAAY